MNYIRNRDWFSWFYRDTNIPNTGSAVLVSECGTVVKEIDISTSSDSCISGQVSSRGSSPKVVPGTYSPIWRLNSETVNKKFIKGRSRAMSESVLQVPIGRLNQEIEKSTPSAKSSPPDHDVVSSSSEVSTQTDNTLPQELEGILKLINLEKYYILIINKKDLKNLLSTLGILGTLFAINYISKRKSNIKILR